MSDASKTYDLVIIGAGPAGMTAAIYAQRANLHLLLLDKLAPGGQVVNTLEVQNYPATGTINGAELAIKMFEHTQEMGVEFDYGTVDRIELDGDDKILHCEEGQTYRCKAVIIATGTMPRRLGVPGEDDFAGGSLSWCAICDGAQYRDKRVVVIGGGNSAVEESLYLASIATELTVITMLDLTADPSACDKLRAMPNVKIYEWHDIIEFTGGERMEKVRAKSSKTGEEIVVETDGAFEYIGLEPTAQAFESLGILNKFGYIETDEWMATKVPGIFGAGDINSKVLRQIVTACSDGALAAQGVSKYLKSLSQ